MHRASPKKSPGDDVAVNTIPWIVNTMNQKITFQGPASLRASGLYEDDSEIAPL